MSEGETQRPAPAEPGKSKTERQKMKTIFTIIAVDIDDDGYTTATVFAPSWGEGILSDHPYLADKDGSHYYHGISDMKVGDTIALG